MIHLYISFNEFNLDTELSKIACLRSDPKSFLTFKVSALTVDN